MPPLPPPITSRTNARVKALRASLSGEARQPGDLLGLEGEHLLAEALAQQLSLETVYLRQGSEDLLERRGLHGLRAAHWVVLSRDAFDSAVTTAAPQGIAATWSIQQPAPKQRSPLVLVAEAIQDPGNLGTLIRSALAFGVNRVMVTPDTVNHWNPKVVRAAAGAIFCVDVERLPLEAIAQNLRAEGTRLFAAVVSPHALRCFETPFPAASAILVGNEGAGLSSEALALADAEVFIPCQAESLNAAVAGSVLLYEAMRQRAVHPQPAPARVSR